MRGHSPGAAEGEGKRQHRLLARPQCPLFPQTQTGEKLRTSTLLCSALLSSALSLLTLSTKKPTMSAHRDYELEDKPSAAELEQSPTPDTANVGDKDLIEHPDLAVRSVCLASLESAPAARNLIFSSAFFCLFQRAHRQGGGAKTDPPDRSIPHANRVSVLSDCEDTSALPLADRIFQSSDLIPVQTFIDRTNIGNARSAGLNTDLGLVGFQYNIGLTVFCRYLVCESRQAR